MITLAYYTRNSLVYPCSCLTTSHLGWVVGTNILWLKSATWSILVPIHSATPGWKVAHPVQWLVQVLCSGKLLREKTFANFAVLWLFAKKFSPQNLVVWCPLAWHDRAISENFLHKNSRKFSPSKVSHYTVLFIQHLFLYVFSTKLDFGVCFCQSQKIWHTIHKKTLFLERLRIQHWVLAQVLSCIGVLGWNWTKLAHCVCESLETTVSVSRAWFWSWSNTENMIVSSCIYWT